MHQVVPNTFEQVWGVKHEEYLGRGHWVEEVWLLFTDPHISSKFMLLGLRVAAHISPKNSRRF